MRTVDLKQREVINITTAERIGFIADVEMNFENGCVEAVVVPVRRGIAGVFGKRQDCVVPWEKIVSVGRDLVLVELDAVDVVR